MGIKSLTSPRLSLSLHLPFSYFEPGFCTFSNLDEAAQSLSLSTLEPSETKKATQPDIFEEAAQPFLASKDSVRLSVPNEANQPFNTQDSAYSLVSEQASIEISQSSGVDINDFMQLSVIGIAKGSSGKKVANAPHSQF